ncbi:NHL domain containing protein [Asbolus verrucosus]|uniref:NHL domain containing protein n=1 Tax=Asbolus verrucosus TaxID=1661398 RepID=A0A482VQ79_ASBVE|nr:NHL domain containing protein [Asbolus verrucosus]
MERLQIAYARIVRTSDMLKKANAQVDSEFIVVNEKAESELKAIRMTRLELLPCEDDFLHFSVADNGLFNAISSLGDITSRINFQYTTETFNRSDEQLSILSAPLLRMDGTNLNCRPVYGVDLRIIVKYPYDNVPQSFGRDGTDDGLLNRPWGVCCNSSGHIIVSDRSNNRIQVFDSNGRFLYKFGKCGSGPAQFKTPAGITVNPFNQIVVADKDNHRIQILSMLGDPILLFGTEGHANGQFHYPWDVACNAQGDIVVSDTRNHRIQLFNCEGAFIGKFGCDNDWRPPYAKAHKLLDSPRGVCFTPQGNVLVTDFNNHRIVTIDKTLSHAQFLGEEGTGPKQFCRPQGIICDDHGNIIVVDTKNYRLQIFDKHGNFLFEFGKRGRNADQFESPCGMCLTPEGRIIVVDYGHTRVQIF